MGGFRWSLELSKGVRSNVRLAAGKVVGMSITNGAVQKINLSPFVPCWACSCYGRKVEQVVKLRKEGCRITINHENDFHDEMPICKWVAACHINYLKFYSN